MEKYIAPKCTLRCEHPERLNRMQRYCGFATYALFMVRITTKRVFYFTLAVEMVQMRKQHSRLLVSGSDCSEFQAWLKSGLAFKPDLPNGGN
jgi:hypothetical protein